MSPVVFVLVFLTLEIVGIEYCVDRYKCGGLRLSSATTWGLGYSLENGSRCVILDDFDRSQSYERKEHLYQGAER